MAYFKHSFKFPRRRGHGRRDPHAGGRHHPPLQHPLAGGGRPPLRQPRHRACGAFWCWLGLCALLLPIQTFNPAHSHPQTNTQRTNKQNQVKYFAGRLLELLKADGLVPTPESENEYQVAQFDAIFSVGTRRNEVWAVLKEHPWKE